MKKQKQREVTDMLNQQTLEMQRRNREREELGRLMDKRMIEMDKKLHEENLQKDRDRDIMAK